MVDEGYYLEVEVDSCSDKLVYYCLDKNIKKGDKIIVETSFGLEVGTVTKDPVKESDSENHSYSQIVREATEIDMDSYWENKKISVESADLFNKSVRELELNMKLVDVVYNLDRSKILFTYVSDERVDFRELLKTLSTNLKCRIELKQIGPRDRSKKVGGIGICGLPLCCKSFLNEFEGISINMAKNQFLALNIQKISGQCGKLLCCLKYEDEQYSELKKDAPKYGFRFNYDGKDYKITSVNLLSRMIKIESVDKEIIKILSFDEFEEMNKK